MAELVLLTMLVALTLYAVMGGADFGAGMIEPWLGPRGQAQVEKALLPVWEVNHVWLVLVAVLAFVGFPRTFALISIDLHIPILLVLLGVVARGSAFTFRHYDPHAGALFPWYTHAFRFGSWLTPLFLGVMAAALVQGTIPLTPRGSFYDVFVAPWNTAFCWATGAFTCALFAFEAAALLAAESATREPGPLPLLRLTRRLHALSIGCGGLVLVCAFQARLAWLTALTESVVSRTCLLVATLLVPVIASAFHRGRPWLLRLSSGAQLLCVLVGFVGAQYPVLVRHDQGVLTVAEAAPPATLRTLLIALAIGLSLILPGLLLLLRTYKRREA